MSRRGRNRCAARGVLCGDRSVAARSEPRKRRERPKPLPGLRRGRSCRHPVFRRGQLLEILRRLACLAGRGEHGALVALQDLEPVPDVLGMLERAIDRESLAEKRRAHLGDQFLKRIGVRSETAGQVPIASALGTGPVNQLVERGAVVRPGVHERASIREPDVIRPGPEARR